MSISLGTLFHIGYVVRDADKFGELLSSTYGSDPLEPFEYWPTKEEMLIGEPFGLKVAFTNLGEAPIELLQPLKGDSVLHQALKAGREGVHHLCYSVPNWEEVVEELKSRNGQIIAGASFNDKRWCYIDMKDGGLVLEIAEEGLLS